MSIFRQISFVFLSLAMLMKAFVVPIICLDYELRKEYIIKNYCINKSRPELHCDGKCYLAKKIKANQEKEENGAFQTFVESLLEPNFYPKNISFVFDNNLIVSLNHAINYQYLLRIPVGYCPTVFHPPSLF